MPIQEMPIAHEEHTRPVVGMKPAPCGPAAPSRKGNRKLWLAVAGIILLAAIAAVLYRGAGKPAPAAWTAAVVGRGTVTKSMSATGRLDALTTVNVGS